MKKSPCYCGTLKVETLLLILLIVNIPLHVDAIYVSEGWSDLMLLNMLKAPLD